MFGLKLVILTGKSCLCQFHSTFFWSFVFSRKRGTIARRTCFILKQVLWCSSRVLHVGKVLIGQFFGLSGFERALLSASLSVYNNISACYRQKIFALKGPCHPLSYLVHNNVSACRRQKFFVLFGFERAHLSKSACCRQKFFGFERASSASLLILT